MTLHSLSAHPDLSVDVRDDHRGREMFSELGQRLGRVRDVLVEDGVARYLDLEAGEFFDGRRVLVPVDAVVPSDKRRAVVLPGAAREIVRALPEFDGDAARLTREHEDDIRAALGGRRREIAITPAELALAAASDDSSAADSLTGPDDDTDARPRTFAGDAARRVERAEEELQFRKHTVDAGEVVVRKRVEVEHVRVPASRWREEVAVDRVAADGARDQEGMPYRVGDELRIPIVEEELVVETRRVVREVLVVRTTRVSETVEFEADLKRERVDVETTGRVRADPPPR